MEERNLLKLPTLGSIEFEHKSEGRQEIWDHLGQI